jgi:hypothetical protein
VNQHPPTHRHGWTPTFFSLGAGFVVCSSP